MTMIEENTLPFAARFWRYQSERFPFAKNGLLIAAFASSAVCLSALLRGQAAFPAPGVFLSAFATLLGFFLLLRIADEFKDAETDRAHRPERPVPRGLVTLRELALLGLATVLAQALIAVGHGLPLLAMLALVWMYMALMSAEFFVPDWLRRRPAVYMISHMAIMPLIDLFATACDWMTATGSPPPGLLCFLLLSFFNGLVLEIGRKTWAPSMERPGVESYSASWGLGPALGCWLAAATASCALALTVARQIDFLLPAAGVLLGFLALMAITAWRFHSEKSAKQAKTTETLAGLWVFLNYLLLGLVPMTAEVLT